MKYDHMPEHLYKYRTFYPQHMEALKQGVLYAAPLDSLNDIRESNIVVSEKAEELLTQKTYDAIRMQYDLPCATIHNQEELIRIIESHFKDYSRKFGINKQMPETIIRELINETEQLYTQLIESYTKDIKTMYSACCFSQSNDIFKMWGYYADCYNGFCVEYDFKSLGRDDLLTAWLFPVIYVEDNRVIVDDVDYIDGNIGLLAATIKTKQDWEYEKEWRLVYPGTEARKPQPMPKPTAIYIGDRTDQDNTLIMKEFCKNIGIPLFRMRYNQRNDKLEPQQLN